METVLCPLSFVGIVIVGILLLTSPCLASASTCSLDGNWTDASSSGVWIVITNNGQTATYVPHEGIPDPGWQTGTAVIDYGTRDVNMTFKGDAAFPLTGSFTADVNDFSTPPAIPPENTSPELYGQCRVVVLWQPDPHEDGIVLLYCSGYSRKSPGHRSRR